MGLALVAVLASWFVVLIAATSVRTPDPQYETAPGSASG